MILTKNNQERLKDIHNLTSYLNIIITGDYDTLPDDLKKSIREKMKDLKVNINYIIEQYLKERYNEK